MAQSCVSSSPTAMSRIRTPRRIPSVMTSMSAVPPPPCSSVCSPVMAVPPGDVTSDQMDAIAALAKKTGMRISGPNAEGFLSEVQKVAATFSPTVDIKPGQNTISIDGDEVLVEDPDTAGDLCGHGTACAGVIRSIAPECATP